jgi:release factor glutamine methyltransferase
VVQPAERFPLVLADPPYLPSGEVHRFPDDPPEAVDGGQDGLDLVRLALRLGGEHLSPGGSLVLQLRGQEQAEEVRRWLDGQHLGLAVAEVREHGEDRALARVVPAQSTTK